MSYKNRQNINCWILDNGKIGNLIQSKGLAEAIGLSYEIKQVKLKSFWNSIPPIFTPNSIAIQSPLSDVFSPPWPDILISSGRTTANISAAIRNLSQNKTKTIYIQNPKIPPDNFDLIIAPEHDNLKGDNIIRTTGSLNILTQEKIDKEARSFSSEFSELPSPRFVVLIGGPNKIYSYSSETIQQLIHNLKRLCSETKGSLLITTSRRTPTAVLKTLKSELKNTNHYLWDHKSKNPYLAYLGLCDGLIVTSDSINMISECCFTGKPIGIHYLPKKLFGSKKFEIFHNSLHEKGYIQNFSGKLLMKSYSPLKETQRVALEVKKRLNLKL